uniref:NADH-ubiquinone oxidoreductase chain 4L n=1 Tax=Duplodicodrilus schmardae TaxID=320986 RepID=A0A142AG19_9ANNE|nr:NADH dehydrogenase subunit 4L [Duplodicodrilus schmardae]AMO27030.1 NADH dehydrogenase subunit 4L [Duplodicodrilus schmardae]BDQ43689.1 NADH dehydrogenase subunit 4L [Duplodicodrilus schmardae]BDQ43845.1 NADH dehydrogenase subunit 4L [Duplodicodrilus schmardae]
MNNSMLTIVCLMPLMAMTNLLFNQTHFLMTLLSLESITLSLVLFVPLMLMNSAAPNTAMAVILLTFGACEASLGLSLMVAMSRSYGNDMLKSLTTVKC